MKKITIYMPVGGCDMATYEKLRAYYKNADFQAWYRDGMIMWQDALAAIPK